MGRAILLTGAPGVGKTTLIQRVLARLTGPAGGFYTGELRERGQRVGFRLVTLAGESVTLAHVEIAGRYRVGRYGVDLAALDRVGVKAVRQATAAGHLVVVDEIGKMECRSARFVEAMRRLFESGRPVVATIALHGGGFIAEAKRLANRTLWEVNRANREDMPGRVLRWLAERAFWPAGH